MMYLLNDPNIDRLLAVVLEDPMSSNMCFQVTEERTGKKTMSACIDSACVITYTYTESAH